MSETIRSLRNVALPVDTIQVIVSYVTVSPVSRWSPVLISCVTGGDLRVDAQTYNVSPVVGSFATSIAPAAIGQHATANDSKTNHVSRTYVTQNPKSGKLQLQSHVSTSFPTRLPNGPSTCALLQPIRRSPENDRRLAVPSVPSAVFMQAYGAWAIWLNQTTQRLSASIQSPPSTQQNSSSSSSAASSSSSSSISTASSALHAGDKFRRFTTNEQLFYTASNSHRLFCYAIDAAARVVNACIDCNEDEDNFQLYASMYACTLQVVMLRVADWLSTHTCRIADDGTIHWENPSFVSADSTGVFDLSCDHEIATWVQYLGSKSVTSAPGGARMLWKTWAISALTLYGSRFGDGRWSDLADIRCKNNRTYRMHRTVCTAHDLLEVPWRDDRYRSVSIDDSSVCRHIRLVPRVRSTDPCFADISARIGNLLSGIRFNHMHGIEAS